MYRHLRSLCASSAGFALLLTLALPAAPAVAAQSPKAPGKPAVPNATVQVNCDAGETLADALATRADQLTIEFTGTCVEDLVVERDRVAIVGQGDAVLQGDDDDPSLTALWARGSDLDLRDFTITGGPFGLRVTKGAGVVASGMHFDGNAIGGVFIEDSSSVNTSNSTFNDNGFAGLIAFSGSAVSVSGSIDMSRNGQIGLFLSSNAAIENRGARPFVTNDNGAAGVAAQLEASGQFPPIQASGNGFAGIWVLGGKFYGVNLNITDNFNGVYVYLGGHFEGTGVIADNENFAIESLNRSQVIFAGPQQVVGDVSLEGSAGELNNTTIDGDVYLTFGSRFSMNGTTFDHLYCDDTVLVRGASCEPLPASAQSLRVGPVATGSAWPAGVPQKDGYIALPE